MDYDYIYDYTYQDITPIPVDQVELLLSDTFEIWKDKFNKAVDAMNVSIGEISQTIKEIPKPGDVPPRNHASTSTEFGLPSTTEYGHPKASNTTPLAPTQKGAIGDDLTIYARADHAHPYGKSTALAEAVTVDGVDFDGSKNIHHYGTCSTAATTVAKTVKLTGFVLATGAIVHVKFTNSNNATDATLNVNSTGAKNIRMNNMNVPPGIIQGNSVYSFIYDGTYWQLTSGGGGGSIATNGTGIYNNNLNNLTVAGRYFITTTASTPNAPLAVAGSWWVDVSVYNNGSSAQILQEARLHSANGNSATQGPANILVRCYDGSKWGEWAYQYAMFAG